MAGGKLPLKCNKEEGHHNKRNGLVEKRIIFNGWVRPIRWRKGSRGCGVFLRTAKKTWCIKIFITSLHKETILPFKMELNPLAIRQAILSK